MPKVVPKDAHTTKHTSDGFYIPLGGFMAEWGRARDEDTFHVMADCNGGQVRKT
ncbi:hypothetical protein [Salinibacter grassmerensis]|uniref:hypothetical protein n=1 Tax=Salinibacter grassmerensis TaxID=3040353 RepID=UPI0021E8AF78|nr:hypothetical protein [Salinibacter grassmerensis]